MWETLFDPSMLDSGKEIAIWCPTREDANGLMDVLDALGYCWCNGDELDYEGTLWHIHKEDTAYVVYPKDHDIAYTSKDIAATEYRFAKTGCYFSVGLYVGGCQSVEVGDLI